MKRQTLISLLFVIAISLSFCQNNKNNNSETNSSGLTLSIDLSADEFERKIAEYENPQLVDVRTAEEFKQGAIGGAVNFDIHNPDFIKQIDLLDKNKPVFVYCLAGGRSAQAAEELNTRGFLNVYNLTGGMMKWRAADKPIKDVSTTAKVKSLSLEEFNEFLNTDKFILIDYNAKWCKPCLKMAPMLDAFAITKKDKLLLIKIDADENKDLLQQKGIEGIPVLELYKDKKLIWQHEGEIDESTLIKETNL